MTEESPDRSLTRLGYFLKELPDSLGALLIGLYATFVPYIANRRFFFNDDEQNQYFPYYIDIGQHLRHFQWPGVTLSTFYGGNLLNDWQYALLNPFNLFMCWIIAPMKNLLLMGLLFFGIYLMLFALGGYWLGRVFGLSRIYSLTMAGCLVMNNYIQYTYCDSWPPGLTSLTWFTWTWVFLEQYRKGGRSIALAGLICAGYLTITSGWPHTMLMLGVLILSYAAELIFVQRLWGMAFKLILANTGVLLITAPYLLPALLSFSWMNRPTGIHSTGLFMPDLGSIINLSSILFSPRIHLFFHENPFYPMMYLGWFILPLLPICSWQVLVAALRKQAGLVIFGAVALFLLFGPESMGPIRWPIRFLPFFHIVILLAFFLVISTPGIFRLTRARLAFVLAILFFQFTSSVSVLPQSLYLQASVLGGSFVMVAVAIRLIQYKNFNHLGLLFLGGMAFFFILTHWVRSTNGDLVDYGRLTGNNSAAPTIAQAFSGYELFMGPQLVYDQDYVPFAAEGIYNGAYTINGYSSLEHIGFNSNIHGHVWTDMADAGGMDFLFEREPTTNKSRLSLMRVNRLLIYNPYYLYAQRLMGKDWIQTSQGDLATRLESAAPNYAHTTLSFASDGIIANPHGEVTGEREQLQIASNPNGGQLVFARLYWPGYEAYLDGKPVAVGPLDKIFVKIDLPPGATGMLTLRFVPPGWRIALILASLGALLCCAALVIKPKASFLVERPAN